MAKPVDAVMAALEGWLFARESPTASPVFRANADVELRRALLAAQAGRRLMVVVVEPVIDKHWVCAAFTPPADDAEPPDDLGAIGGVQTSLHHTVDEAKLHAKQLAALAPGSYYVVYEAQWYAFTTETPVSLVRVGQALPAV